MDGYVPKEGDEVLICATVKFDFKPEDEGVFLKVLGAEHSTVRINPNLIHSVVRKHWNPGDLVWCKSLPARVLAVNGADCWVKCEAPLAESPFTHSGMLLLHREAPPEPVAEAPSPIEQMLAAAPDVPSTYTPGT